MTATVRSVRVVMEAEVAKYVADMRMAGRETSAAFDSSSRSVAGASRQIDAASTSSRRLEQATREAGAGVRRTAKDLDGLGTSAKETSEDVDGLGDSLGGTNRKTKEYSLETAIAEERALRFRRSLRDQARAALDAEEAVAGVGDEVKDLGERSRATEREIDRLSGRVRLLAEAGLVFGPGLIPVIAGLAPAAAGGIGALGALAGGAGVTALAFSGLGDALEAVREYELEPTEDNLRAMEQELSRAGRTGREFVMFLNDVEDELKSLQLVARNQMLPGVEEGIEVALQRLPQVRSLIGSFASELGDLSADAGRALASEEWSPFFDYLARDGVPTLDQVSRGLGNLTLGVANLTVGMAPLTRLFTGGFASSMEDFAAWSAELDENDGFQNFLDYAITNAPKVIDLLGATGSAVGGIAHAAAPVGEFVLPTLTALLEVIGAIGSSPLGPALYTAAAGALVLSRATKLVEASLDRVNAKGKTTGSTLQGIGKGIEFAAVIAGINLVDAAIDRLFDTKIEETTLSRDLTALASGKWTGNLDGIAKDIRKAESALSSLDFVPGDWGFEDAFDNVKAVDEALAQMVESGNGEQAAEAFDQIATKARGMGVSMEDIESRFPQYATAAENAALSSEHYASGVGAAAEASRMTAAEVQGLTDAMNEQANAALEAANADLSYRDALAEARTLASQNEAGIGGMSKAARQNEHALYALAGAWNSQSEAVRNNEGSYRAARRSFIETAVAMGVPRAEARRLADSILSVPRSRAINIAINRGEIDSSVASLERLRTQIESLRNRTITITTVRNSTNKLAGMLEDRFNGSSAEGSTVPKDGGPYSDRYPYLLAPGEEVISNRYGQADRWRPLLKAINAGRLADGGTAGGVRRPGVVRLGGATDNDPARVSDIERVAGGFFIELLNGAAFRVTREGLEGFKGWKPALAELREEMEGTSRVLKNGRTRLTGRGMGRLLDLTGDPDAHLRRIATLANVASLKQLERALKDSQEALDAETQARDSMVSSISSGLTRDWFDTGSGSPWSDDFAAGSPAATIKSLQQQIADANEFDALRTALQGRGLSGPAYDALVGRGDVEELRMWAQATPEQLAQFNALVPAAQGRVSQVAAAAGGVNYGGDIAALAAQFAALRREQQERHKQAQRARKDAPKATGKALGKKAGQGRQKKR